MSNRRVCIVGMGARMSYHSPCEVVIGIKAMRDSVNVYREIEQKSKFEEKHTKDFFRGFKHSKT
jgi:hypothetical protein